MKIFAITKNGLNISTTVEIKQICVWLNGICDHSVNNETLKLLIEQYDYSSKMTITKEGKIDSFDETPLYTNGQESVIRIEDFNGSLIWNKTTKII